MTNSVEVVGRLGSRVTQRELPSGDIATGFAVIVDRPVNDQVGNTKVDTMPCQTFRESVAKKVMAMEPGTPVSCTGVLRRRFWKSPGGLASAVEIEVRAIKRAAP